MNFLHFKSAPFHISKIIKNIPKASSIVTSVSDQRIFMTSEIFQITIQKWYNNGFPESSTDESKFP